MTTRLELVMRGDPILKNELIQGIRSALFSKTPLKSMRGFLWILKGEDDTWQENARLQCVSARNRGIEPVRTPCTVAWTHLRKNAGTIDTAAIAYPTWGILDGVVKGGMLAGDSYRHVVLQTYAVEFGHPAEGIRVLIETVPDSPVQAVLDELGLS